jgi:hypothetical protein
MFVKKSKWNGKNGRHPGSLTMSHLSVKLSPNGVGLCRRKAAPQERPAGSGRLFMSDMKPIKDIEYLEQLIDEGYVLKGRRDDPERNLKALKSFFAKDYELVPEDWLLENGYQLVEPSQFTKGYTLAYKLIDDFPDQYFRSGYSLVKGNKEIFLYLKLKEEL